MAAQDRDGTKRALWAAGAALFVILVTRGALSAPVVVLGAVAAFFTVMIGLRPDATSEDDGPEAPPAPAPREATPFEKAAVGAPPEPAVPAAHEAPGAPALLDAAREGGPDDLKQIKGVGPKLEATLHRLGVFHFDQIAAWSAAEVAWVDENLEGFKGRVTRDDWVAQAKILAAGGESEFSARAERDDAPPSQG